MNKALKTGGEQGFTLLEVMIAVAIIGFALTVIVHTVNYHANVMQENAMTTEMYQHAKEQIFLLKRKPLNSRGTIRPGLNYENIVIGPDKNGYIELKTIFSGYGKAIVLRELITGKTSNSVNND
ncbi:MAG: type II secretion system protein [Nitrospira sp.]|nr:type II secretion system protein [bacterium]MBL7049537.1 type II secretion system protein [Nitrospira sp.]